ncbi:helix-turn-helix domain-containing protein [Christiangramia portivictoriae]|uniref:helix-turn-helix domain-containing protein n=1 Tax=Christiangramia portivictoriae TaxID=326069 RepID=UPI0004019204|nr:AraC family transcriptional regulator [Christiangramia portivictoriae]
MQTVKIAETSAKSILKELASAFETRYTEEYGEAYIEFSNEYGEGKISGINFPNGVGIFRFETRLNEDTCLDFHGDLIHPFKFVYVTEGRLDHSFRDEDIVHHIEKNQSVIIGANSGSGNKIMFPGDIPISVVMLDVDRQKFVDQLTFPLEEMDDIYHGIFADTNAMRTLYHHTQYSLKMSYLIQELRDFTTPGLERVSYYGAKALELLTFILMLYRDDAQPEDSQSVIRQKDLDKVKLVILQIDQNIAEIGNISSLAKSVDITESKLQEGFQVLFNCSVHEYIQRKRMETAMLLLLKTDKTIKEIVYEIGLNSRSHFSKIFKEKYGMTPTAVREKK